MAIYSKNKVLAEPNGKQFARPSNGLAQSNNLSDEGRQTWARIVRKSCYSAPGPANLNTPILRPFHAATWDPGRLDAADRLDWLITLSHDPLLTKLDISVAAVILQHVNSKSGIAWPGQGTIMRMSGAGSRKTVRECVRRLVARAWYIVESGGMKRSGGRMSNRYRIVTARMLWVPPDAWGPEHGYTHIDPFGGPLG